MTEWSLERITAERGQVVLACRFWDGIDHPEWLAIKLGPGQADTWSHIMVEQATEARKQALEDKQERRNAAIAKREALNREIAELDAIIDPA